MKVLQFKFSSAKLYRSKHSYNNSYLKQKYELDTMFVEPITYHQISNMIHVLFNERPVPTKRLGQCSQKINPEYLKIAKTNAYLLIENYYLDKDNNVKYAKEFTQTAKVEANSYNPKTSPSWVYLKSIGKNDKLDVVISRLDNFFKKCSIIQSTDSIMKHPLYELSEFYNKLSDKNKEVIKELFETPDISKLGFKSVYQYMINPLKNSFQLTQGRGDKSILNSNGIEKNLYTFNGKILLYLSETQYSRFLEVSSGTAKLLDGGYVVLEKVSDAEYVDNTDYKKVGDISLKEEKYK